MIINHKEPFLRTIKEHGVKRLSRVIGLPKYAFTNHSQLIRSSAPSIGSVVQLQFIRKLTRKETRRVFFLFSPPLM